jgi:RNA polymerase sigma-B factor
MDTPSRQADTENRKRLIESHLPLVRAIARRYAGRGEPLEDLVQAGSVALVKAADRFDPRRGVAFASFAAPAVEGEIRRHLGDRTPSVRIPRELQRMTGQLRACRAQLNGSLGRPPTVPELAEALAVHEQDVRRALEAERVRDAVPLDGEVPDGSTAAAESLAETEERVLLEHSARVLDARERRIVFLRFQADMTERDIARAVGISQAHVSRLLAGALAKLRTEMTEESGGDITGSAAISPESTSASRAVSRPQRAAEAGKGAERKPKPSPSYSGRFLVRMPGDLHAELARAAEHDHVSLNRFVVDALAAAVEDQPAGPASSSEQDAPGGTGRVSTAGEVAGEPAQGEARTRAGQRRGFRIALVTNLVVVVLAGLLALVLLILAVSHGI